MSLSCQVLVALPQVDACYSYAPPDGKPVGAGHLVRVEFGRRILPAVVWDDPPPAKRLSKIKPLTNLDLPPLVAAQRRFLDWMAHYVMAPRGAVLCQMLNVPSLLAPKPSTRRSKKPVAMSSEPQFATPPLPSALQLSQTQAQASQALKMALRELKHTTHVLDGVTGSGKTEVYFEMLADVIHRKAQGLILLPEIALTAQFLDRFQARFGTAPALWHSALTPKQRRMVWLGVAQGRVQIVVGARSALFLPFQNLAAIVVDEEHDTSFKQNQGLIYSARDMAIAYGAQAPALVVLSSATPSLETEYNMRQKRYVCHRLPQRIGTSTLPQITLLDMRTAPPAKGDFLSPNLLDAIRTSLQAKEQVLLFLNRRGYAPLILCRACGYRYACPHCAAWLVEHHSPKPRLLCHHCGYGTPPPAACKRCHTAGTLAACGPGVERIAQEVHQHFPKARSLVLSSDKERRLPEWQALWQDIASGGVDILIGTQILAKGHHFPRLNLVGVVDADLGLSHTVDPRASERSWQLLQQVAGRAGRAGGIGRAILQSYDPTHPMLQTLQDNDREKFLSAELAARRHARMPPFGALALIMLSGRHEDALQHFAGHLSRRRPMDRHITVAGPAPPPFYRLRGLYRQNFLVMAPRKLQLQPYIKSWLARSKVPKSLRLAIDIDPQSFL